MSEKIALSPSPQNYLLPSTLKNQPRTFGIDRDKYKKVMLRTAPLVNFFSPGPGKYEPKPWKDTSKFTMRTRTKLEENITSKIVPGPGNYPPMSTITPLGKFRISSLRDTGLTRFNPPSSARFSPISNFCL